MGQRRPVDLGLRPKLWEQRVQRGWEAKSSSSSSKGFRKSSSERKTGRRAMRRNINMVNRCQVLAVTSHFFFFPHLAVMQLRLLPKGLRFMRCLRVSLAAVRFTITSQRFDFGAAVDLRRRVSYTTRTTARYLRHAWVLFLQYSTPTSRINLRSTLNVITCVRFRGPPTSQATQIMLRISHAIV